MIEKMVILPVICGILALMVFFLYLYSANHAPYRYTDIISLYPLFSFIGLLISVITIKEKVIQYYGPVDSYFIR